MSEAIPGGIAPERGFMFSRFTAAARRVMQRAFREAKRCEHDFVGTEHLLFGALYDPDGPAVVLLRTLGAGPEVILEKVELSLQRHDGGMAMEQFPLSPASKRAFQAASEEAAQFNHQMIGPEHLLLGVLREHDCEAAQLLAGHGVTLAAVRDAVARIPPDAYHDAQIRAEEGNRSTLPPNPSADELEAWIAPGIYHESLQTGYHLPVLTRVEGPAGFESQLRRTQLFLGAFGAYVLGHWTTGHWQVGVILAAAGAVVAYINRSWVSIPVCGFAALLAAEGHRRHGGFPPPMNPVNYMIALPLGLLFGSFLCDFWRFMWTTTHPPTGNAAVTPADHWVAPDAPLPVGAAVFLRAQGRWWRGVVVGDDAAQVRVRYPGTDGNWEETVPRHELRLPPS